MVVALAERSDSARAAAVDALGVDPAGAPAITTGVRPVVVRCAALASVETGCLPPAPGRNISTDDRDHDRRHASAGRRIQHSCASCAPPSR